MALICINLAVTNDFIIGGVIEYLAFVVSEIHWATSLFDLDFR